MRAVEVSIEDGATVHAEHVSPTSHRRERMFVQLGQLSFYCSVEQARRLALLLTEATPACAVAPCLSCKAPTCACARSSAPGYCGACAPPATAAGHLVAPSKESRS